MDTYDKYFDCVCRTCMNELLEAFSFEGDKKPQGWLSVFDRIEEEHCSLPIAELLTQAVPKLELQLSDQLPKKICCNCLQQLLSVYRFQQMCLQSEQQMRQQVSKKQTDLRIRTTAIEGEIETKNAGSYLLDQSSIQKPLFQTTEQIVKPEAVEMDDNSHLQHIDQSLEDSSDSQGNFSELIKNEPIEDDEPSVEYSEDDTIQAITVKGEMLAIEEQQINETNVKTHRTIHGEDKPYYECPYCPRRFNSNAKVLQHKAIHKRVKREICNICGKRISKHHLKIHKLTHSDVKPLKCDFCEKRFVQISQVRAHMLQHTGEKPYKCNYCELAFTRNATRLKHMRVHLGDNVHRCRLCPLAFPSLAQLRSHLTTHKNEDPETFRRNMKALKIAEAKLELKFKQKENVKPHRIIQGEERPYECPYCPRRFTGKQNLYQHKKMHEGVKREDCDICGKSFRKSNLNQHKRIHSNEKAYKCDFCDKRFIQMSHLRCHVRQHTGEKPYKCKYCDSAFARNDIHRRHMRIHFGDNVHRCNLCPLGFSLATELRLHFTTHKNDDSETQERNMKALKEEEAKLGLTSAEETQHQLEKKATENVKTHRFIHGEERPHECPYCPRRFRTKATLAGHEALHEGVKRKACDICGKSIRNLRQHKLLHSNEKAFKCDVCEKRFTQISMLRIHMRKHTGEKPYKCKYCESTFARHDYRKKHMRMHFGDNVYRCNLCPLAFPLAAELLLHLTTHKHEDSETRERNMKALKEEEAKLKLTLAKSSTEKTQHQLEKKATQNVKTHRIIQDEDNPYECPYCPKRFVDSSSRNKHKQIHEGVKRAACDICGKSIRKSNLNQHKLIHRNEKAFKCDVCDTRFTQMSMLRIHMRKHTGEKPYKCKYCESAFARDDYRKKHMRMHFGDNVHRCHLCPLAFPSTAELRLHLTTHKIEDPETRERNMKALKEEEAKLKLKFAKSSKKEAVQQLEMKGTE